MAQLKDKLKQFGAKSNAWLKRGDLVITIIFVIGILAVVNFFSYQIFTRLDLTQNNIYSISEVSKRSVSELDDVLRIKIYFSDNLPSKYTNLESQVRDFLSEYVSYSSGQVKIESINPKELDNAQQKLSRLQIPQMRFNVMKEGSYQVSTGYMGIAVQYGDESEAIPVVKSTNNLEYKITTAIKKVTQKDMPSVGLVTSHGSLTAAKEELKTAKEKLNDIYQVREVDLTSEEVPDGVKTLILPGPKEKLASEQLEKLDSFVMKGGSLLLLVDGVKIEDGLVATQNDTGINDLVNSYGLELNQNVVLDDSCGRVAFNSGMFTFQSQYPAWVKITSENFNQDNVAVSDLESVTLPWPSSVEIIGTSSDQYITLAQSTSESWVQKEQYELRPNSDFSPEDTQQRKMAVMTSGELKSAYSDQSTEQGKVVLVGDSDFVKDRFLSQSKDNMVFLQNLVDSVTLDEDLIKIRSKQVTDRPLEDISAVAQTAVKYFNIFGLPVVVVIFGLIRYYTRKRRS